LPDGLWPQPLGSAHPNGAARLAELHLQSVTPLRS
jgi:hypothetical protein